MRGPAADVDAPMRDAKDSGDGCNHAMPPPRPTTPDGADIAPVVVVAKQILLSTPTGAVPVGYDLDDVCTTDTATETCTGEKPHIDPPGGIDNNGGDLFNLVKTKTDVEQRINDGIALGQTTLLFRLANYNGTPNDPNIIFSSTRRPASSTARGSRCRRASSRAKPGPSTMPSSANKPGPTDDHDHGVRLRRCRRRISRDGEHRPELELRGESEVVGPDGRSRPHRTEAGREGRNHRGSMGGAAISCTSSPDRGPPTQGRRSATTP